MLTKAAVTLSGGDTTQLTYALDGSMKVYLTSDPTKSVTFQSLTGEPWLIGVGHYVAPGNTSQFVYGTCVAEVDVDTDTGLISVTNVTQYDDVGQVIFPAGMESQAYSGIIQGINIALQEEDWPDTQTGMPIFYSHLDSRTMLIGQTPANLTTGYVNNAEQPPDSTGNFGAKGTAEPWDAAVAPAIASAFANATGVHIYQLPMTPEKVLAALGKTNQPNLQVYGYGGGN
jgi:CO/xanthine dehydrogenase Mo-binding subunit